MRLTSGLARAAAAATVFFAYPVSNASAQTFDDAETFVVNTFSDYGKSEGSNVMFSINGAQVHLSYRAAYQNNPTYYNYFDYTFDLRDVVVDDHVGFTCRNDVSNGSCIRVRLRTPNKGLDDSSAEEEEHDFLSDASDRLRARVANALRFMQTKLGNTPNKSPF